MKNFRDEFVGALLLEGANDGNAVDAQQIHNLDRENFNNDLPSGSDEDSEEIDEYQAAFDKLLLAAEYEAQLSNEDNGIYETSDEDMRYAALNMILDHVKRELGH
tara:strand:+ start:9663 stop:9977 length:315 start_codon:yes stop_codon:yes gene_type:complete